MLTADNWGGHQAVYSAIFDEVEGNQECIGKNPLPKSRSAHNFCLAIVIVLTLLTSRPMPECVSKHDPSPAVPSGFAAANLLHPTYAFDVRPFQSYPAQVMARPHSNQHYSSMQGPMTVYSSPQPLYADPRELIMPITHPTSMTRSTVPIGDSTTAPDLWYTCLEILRQRGHDVNELFRQARQVQLQSDRIFLGLLPPLWNSLQPPAHAVANNVVLGGSDQAVPIGPKILSSTAGRSRSKTKLNKSNQRYEPASLPRRSRASSSKPSWTRLPPPVRPTSQGNASIRLAQHPKGSCPMIFTSISGAPLSFFVQIGLTDRFSLVTKIKVSSLPIDVFNSHQSLFQNNNGTIVGDNTTANYIILDSSRGKDFGTLLASTVAAGRVAVRAVFVDDCIEEGVLLSTASYSFSEVGRKRAIVDDCE